MKLKRVKVKIDFLVPGMSFVQPLFAQNGDVLLKPRVYLTPEIIDDLKKIYGEFIYYDVPDTSGSLIEKHMESSLNESRVILEEITRTNKLSESGYRKAERVVEEFISDLEQAEIKAINLLKELKTFDEYQYQHQVNVGILATIFARKIGYFSQDEIKFTGLGSFLIDIGKMKIDRQLLNKDTAYDISEMQKIRRHPQLGYELLKDIPGISPIVLQTVLFHHEKYNNRGYYGLPYKNLPMHPKIAGICDIYDALTSNRPHRNAYPIEMSMKFIVNTINSQFDYNLISSFVNLMGPLLNQVQTFYSRNDLCELNTREIAVIKNFSLKDYLKPVVIIFCKFDRLGRRLEVNFYKKPVEIDLHLQVDRYITKILTNSQQIETIRRSLVIKGILLDYL